jgi:hypothetical protein
VLKKAGIVVAAATAGLLALSPLAFAGDKGHEDPKGAHSTTVVNEETTSRSVDCDFEQDNDNSIEQEGVGGDSLLGLGGLVANTATPVNTDIQAAVPIGSCNNDEDNDETTSVDDSFNTED